MDTRRTYTVDLLDNLKTEDAKKVARELSKSLHELKMMRVEPWTLGYMLTCIITVVLFFVSVFSGYLNLNTEPNRQKTFLGMIGFVALYFLVVYLWQEFTFYKYNSLREELEDRMKQPEVVVVVEEMRTLDPEMTKQLDRELKKAVPYRSRRDRRR